MMTVGLHCRLARPGRVAGLAEFLDYAKSFGREVWICTREQIANHWYENHLPRGVGSPIKPGNFSPTNRFAFLGNITQPRDANDEIDKVSPVKAKDDDGDII